MSEKKAEKPKLVYSDRVMICGACSKRTRWFREKDADPKTGFWRCPCGEQYPIWKYKINAQREKGADAVWKHRF